MEWLVVGFGRWISLNQLTEACSTLSQPLDNGHVGSAGRIAANIVQSHKCNILTKHVIPTITRINTEDFDS